MNALSSLIESALEISLRGMAAAIDAAGYAALLACLVLVVDLASRRWLSAAQKNVLWGLVLLRLLMPWAPPSWLSVQNLSIPSSISAPPQQVADWLPATETIESLRSESAGYAAAPAAAEPPPPSDAWRWDDYAFLVVWITWVLGFCFVLIGTAIGYVRLSRRVRKAPVCEDRRLVALWQSCRELAGVRRSIAIVDCDAAGQPALMGFWRPRLLLPADIAGLDDEPLRLIMLHELAHVRRRDVAVNWLLVVVRAMQWWNPVYWLAASRFASLREQACDAWVIRRLGSERTRTYSELLLSLAEREAPGGGWRVTLPASLLGFASSYFRRHEVKKRLRALRFAGGQPGRARTTLAVAAMALVAVSGLTDAMPPTDKRAMLDWVPPITITLDSIAGKAEDGPLVTRSYDISGVLARIEADAAVIPDAAAELKWMIEYILQINRPGVDEDGSQPTPSKASYKRDGNQLIVDAPAILHDRLAGCLRAGEQSGFGQINVECRFMTADHDIAPAAGVAWQFQETGSANSKPALISEPVGGLRPVHAGATVSEYFPMMVTTLDSKQVTALMDAYAVATVQACRRQPPWGPGVQMVSATFINGQGGTFGSPLQTPFVVGLRKTPRGDQEPIIRILEEGTQVTLRAVHSSDRSQVQLAGCLEISKIGDVRTTQNRFDGEAATFQLPSGKRWRIDFDGAVDEGKSLLIGFVPSYEQPLVVYALLTVRTLVPEAEMAALHAGRVYGGP